jgi:hypothetical protein
MSLATTSRNPAEVKRLLEQRKRLNRVIQQSVKPPIDMGLLSLLSQQAQPLTKVDVISKFVKQDDIQAVKNAILKSGESTLLENVSGKFVKDNEGLTNLPKDTFLKLWNEWKVKNLFEKSKEEKEKARKYFQKVDEKTKEKWDALLKRPNPLEEIQREMAKGTLPEISDEILDELIEKNLKKIPKEEIKIEESEEMQKRKEAFQEKINEFQKKLENDIAKYYKVAPQYVAQEVIPKIPKPFLDAFERYWSENDRTNLGALFDKVSEGVYEGDIKIGKISPELMAIYDKALVKKQPLTEEEEKLFMENRPAPAKRSFAKKTEELKLDIPDRELTQLEKDELSINFMEKFIKEISKKPVFSANEAEKIAQAVVDFQFSIGKNKKDIKENYDKAIILLQDKELLSNTIEELKKALIKEKAKLDKNIQIEKEKEEMLKMLALGEQVQTKLEEPPKASTPPRKSSSPKASTPPLSPESLAETKTSTAMTGDTKDDETSAYITDLQRNFDPKKVNPEDMDNYTANRQLFDIVYNADFVKFASDEEIRTLRDLWKGMPKPILDKRGNLGKYNTNQNQYQKISNIIDKLEIIQANLKSGKLSDDQLKKFKEGQVNPVKKTIDELDKSLVGKGLKQAKPMNKNSKKQSHSKYIVF